jgi:hypothetical protein
MNMPTHMLPRDMQLSNEFRYSKKHIDTYIAQEIAGNPDTEAKVQKGVALLLSWLNQSYYASKNARLAQMQGIDLEETVRKIFVNVTYCQIPELFTSVTAQLAGVLKMSDKSDSITTIGEMLAVLCLTDAFDIVKTERSASLVVQSHLPVSEALISYITQSRYLPPMVCTPETITNNYESPYLTHNDCVILGKGNAHSGDVCLDILNRQNSIPMKLNLDFLSSVEEEPTHVLDDQRKWEQWHTFKRESYEIYTLLAKQGNRFYFHHKVDKRGRCYSQGYHVTPQGSSFKKAMLEFAEEEAVTGVPDHLRVLPS